MQDVDKLKMIERYETRQRTLGPGPAALGEPKQRQFFYFSMLLGFPEFEQCGSILDLGCGYGDLSRYLRTQGWQGRYVGIDVVPGLIEEAKRKYPDEDLRVHDIEKGPLSERFDWVVSVGALGCATEAGDYYQHLTSVVEAAWGHADKGMSFDLFSPLAEFQNPLHHHVDFGRLLGLVTRLTGRFTMRHDYMPFSFATYLYKEAAIDRSLSIFEAWRPQFDRVRALDVTQQ